MMAVEYIKDISYSEWNAIVDFKFFYENHMKQKIEIYMFHPETEKQQNHGKRAGN